jgi:hypothetical protein
MRRQSEDRPFENNVGAALAPDEVEFMMAIDRYKRLANRPFPGWHEVLRVLKELGYRRIEQTCREPRPPSE